VRSFGSDAGVGAVRMRCGVSRMLCFTIGLNRGSFNRCAR
jgi:hypothetical protein